MERGLDIYFHVSFLHPPGCMRRGRREWTNPLREIPIRIVHSRVERRLGKHPHLQRQWENVFRREPEDAEERVDCAYRRDGFEPENAGADEDQLGGRATKHDGGFVGWFCGGGVGYQV